ncbi:hypothetical protein BGZ88_000261, partial [Linnemannia elongata]
MKITTLITIFAALAVIQSAPTSMSKHLESVEKRHSSVLARSLASDGIVVTKRHSGFMRREVAGDDKKKRSLMTRRGDDGHDDNDDDHGDDDDDEHGDDDDEHGDDDDDHHGDDDDDHHGDDDDHHH